MKKQCKIFFLLLILPFLGYSNGTDFRHTKQKNIKKTYFVNSDAGLNIDNSYGNIIVTTWDQDKIELDILIKVSGDNENWVNQRINDIDVDITALKSMISAKTIIGNTNSKSNRTNNSFEINYTLRIPKNGTVKLNNKYGNIITTDLFSNTDIYCKYGKITIGRLSGSKSNIQIEYCTNSSIEFLKNGGITAKYSNLKIGEVTKLDLISDYTDVDIQDGDAIKYISRYGNIKIQNVKSLEASGNYLTLKIGELFNNLKLSEKYGSIAIGTINAQANNINIVAAYTGITIGFDPNYSFDFNVSLKYANLKYDTDLKMNSKEELSNSKIYSGFYNRKGINNLSVISNYGNVSLSKN